MSTVTLVSSAPGPIATITVVPVPRGLRGSLLLAEGPLGVRPPTLWVNSGLNLGLVLAWRGSVLADGLARALRVLAEHKGLDPAGGCVWEVNDDRGRRPPRAGLCCADPYDDLESQHVWRELELPVDDHPLRPVVALATVLVFERLAERVVYLDAGCCEVTP